MDELTTQQLLTNIRQLIEQAQARAVRSVNFERVLLYWNMGEEVSFKRKPSPFTSPSATCSQ